MSETEDKVLTVRDADGHLVDLRQLSIQGCAVSFAAVLLKLMSDTLCLGDLHSWLNLPNTSSCFTSAGLFEVFFSVFSLRFYRKAACVLYKSKVVRP